MSYPLTGFAVVLILAGVYHFYNPAFYDPFMPEWFPKQLANAAGGLAEILIGAALFYEPTRQYAIWAAFGLMIIFLPLHVIDLMKERPMVGSKMGAVIRLIIQFVLIWWLWRQGAGAGAGDS